MLDKYGSLSTALSHIYGEDREHRETTKEAFDRVCATLKIKSASDWYKYTLEDIKRIGLLAFLLLFLYKNRFFSSVGAF